VRIGIGLVALAGAAYQLRKYVLARGETCPVTAPEARRQILARLRGLAARREFYVALAGIVALAFAVNLVELLCSAGIPVVYTQVLAMSDLPLLQYYAYLLLYVAVFMLDDLVVLVLALATLHVSGLATSYARFSHLASCRRPAAWSDRGGAHPAAGVARVRVSVRPPSRGRLTEVKRPASGSMHRSTGSCPSNSCRSTRPRPRRSRSRSSSARASVIPTRSATRSPRR